MKQAYLYLMDGKDLFLPSLFLGGSFTAFKSILTASTPSEIFGYSLSIWFVALVINGWDIYTGVKADIKRRKDLGENFVFDSEKGAKAFEKILGFTVIIATVYHFQLESIRLGYPDWIATGLNYIKSIFFFYVILIEFQSIGENNEVRHGDKGKLFKMLDGLIDIINKGIFDKLKSLLGINKD